MYDFIGLNDEKIAVNCKTKEQADKFYELCRQMNIEWVTGRKLEPIRDPYYRYILSGDDFWYHHKQDTCYSIRNNMLYYSTIDMYETQGYTIIDFDEVSPIPTIM